MRRNILIFALAWLFPSILFAQYTTVSYDYEKNWFNGSGNLPAEKHWMLYGPILPYTNMVKVDIFNTDNVDLRPIYSSTWRMPFNKTTTEFSVPINHNLRGNSKYTFSISYFRNITDREKETLQGILNDIINTYINQSIKVTNKKVSLRKNPKTVLEELNTIVKEGTANYSTKNGFDFRGFSSLVVDKLNQIDELKLRKAKRTTLSYKENKNNAKVKYLEAQLNELKILCSKEVAQYLATDLVVIYDRRVVFNYYTEKVRNTVSIDAGYAGVYYSGSLTEMTSGSQAFVGMSVPFANSKFSSKFWSNTAVSAGVFVQNIDFGNNLVGSGPIINRPIYVGLGYKTLYFIRINAGVTMLQTKVSNNSLDFNNIYLRPYVGFSLEFNLWLGIDK